MEDRDGRLGDRAMMNTAQLFLATVLLTVVARRGPAV